MLEEDHPVDLDQKGRIRQPTPMKNKKNTPDFNASNPPLLRAAIQEEIEALHALFVAWFTGSAEPIDEDFRAIEDALDTPFVLISPSGRLQKRDALLQSLRKAHGCFQGSDFTIWIKDVRLQHLRGGTILATYEEWQRHKGKERGRLSSALFVQEEETPRGLRWLHVHETWLPELESST